MYTYVPKCLSKFPYHEMVPFVCIMNNVSSRPPIQTEMSSLLTQSTKHQGYLYSLSYLLGRWNLHGMKKYWQALFPREISGQFLGLSCVSYSCTRKFGHPACGSNITSYISWCIQFIIMSIITEVIGGVKLLFWQGYWMCLNLLACHK